MSALAGAPGILVFMGCVMCMCGEVARLCCERWWMWLLCVLVCRRRWVVVSVWTVNL